MSGTSPWRISIRNIDMNEVESGDGYKRLRMELNRNGLGTWTLELPGVHTAVEEAIKPGAGIVVRREGTNEVEMSGMVADLYFSESRNSPGGDVTLVGVTDEIFLHGELAFVNPSLDVPTNMLRRFSPASDFRSGSAETCLKGYVSANIGPAAGLARRRYPFLNIPPTAAQGTSGLWHARFDNLLEVCQRIASYGGINFRLAQSAPGEITLYVTVPTQIPEARFSIESHNLSSVVATFRVPDVDEIVVGGGGEGEARYFTRRNVAGLAATYGKRSVRFIDTNRTIAYSEMQQSAQEDLAEGIATSGIQLNPVDTPHLRYGVHYRLGDIVTASVRGVEITDKIEQVLIEHEPGSTPSITPSIGLPNQEEGSRNIPLFRRILRDLANANRS